ncbi:unnamed protein product [marine sediment metagenome]|uniref:Uncharacterized protein n=1 Tax=marine sediment metagenome TaxID=412755 RepID=X1BIU7_9ZZZZ
MKPTTKVFDSLTSIKAFAREYIYVDIALLNEGMNADVALSNKNKP